MFNKKNIWITLFFSIISIALCVAQDKNRFQAIENEKITYITNELHLTHTEVQRFLPLYNEYNEMLWDIRKEKLSGIPRKGVRGSSRDILKYDARELQIKKEYRLKFAKIIGHARASQFFEVEQEFRKYLYKAIQHKVK
ncbi:hypothetical protein BWD42_11830 [Sphingobacterium sp. CZ-UAM]|nr:hypothetical protein BWD42_11830 [Sphingobacterium sp. CZ-UAM]